MTQIVKVVDLKLGSRKIQWISAFLANCTIFSYGMQSGWMSPSIKVLQSDASPSGYPLNDYQISWIASSICIFGAISSNIYSYAADRFGRKAALIATAVPQALAWILKLCSAHPISLIIARGLCGVAGAGCFCVAPLYTKEVSDDKIRGTAGSMGMLLQCCGTLIMYAMGSYLDYYTVLWIIIWLPMINVLFLLKVPESPSYLIKIGKNEQAMETMALLRGVDRDDKGVMADIKKIANEDAYYKSISKISIKDILANKAWRRGLLLCYLLMTALDTGGNFAIFAYASVIISAAGVTISPELQSLSFPAFMIVGSLLSMTCIEKFGRKPLILIALFFTGIPLAILGTVLLVQYHGYTVPGWIPILSMIVSVFSYSAGVLPVPYVVMSEMFNFQIRAKLMGFLVTYGWLMCFLQIITFTPISQHLGMYTMFYIYAFLNLSAIFVIMYCLPETKGKTVDEIEKMLLR